MSKKSDGIMMAKASEPKHVGDLYLNLDKHAKGLKNKKVGHKFQAIVKAEKISHSNDMGEHRGTIRIHKLILNRGAEEGAEHEAGESPEVEAQEDKA